MNRHHSWAFWTAPHQLKNHRPVVVVTAKASGGGRMSPPRLRDPAEEKKDDTPRTSTSTTSTSSVGMTLPVMQVVAASGRKQQQLPTRRYSHGEVPLQVQVGAKIEVEEDEDVAEEPEKSTTLLNNDASNNGGDDTAATIVSPPLRRTSTNTSSPPAPITTASAALRRNSSSSAPVTLKELRERRRSSRKSVNGLIIEFDLDDESDCMLFGDCDDYEEDLRPDLTRQPSNESLEQLRTRLEALEHERQSEELPDHDAEGLGEECMNKNLMEALENSSSSLQNNSVEGATTGGSNPAAFRQSFASQSGVASLMGIVEFSDEEEGDEGDVLEGAINHNRDDDECDISISSKAQRRSTPRLSINGLVLEYDLSSSEDEAEEEEEEP